MARVSSWSLRRIMYSSRRNSRGSKSIVAFAAFRRALDQIELERSYPQGGFPRFRRTAQQRLYSRDEFDNRERLGEIIVAPHPQSAHAVIDRAKRAQHQHRRAHLILPQGLDDGKAVHSRQQAVDDHRIRPQVACLGETIQPVGRPFHIEAAIGQLGGDFSRRLVIIFYEKNLRHEIIPTAKMPSPRTARLGRNDTRASR